MSKLKIINNARFEIAYFTLQGTTDWLPITWQQIKKNLLSEYPDQNAINNDLQSGLQLLSPLAKYRCTVDSVGNKVN